MTAPWRLCRGAEVQPGGGGVTFRVWAPNCDQLGLRLLGAPARDLALLQGEVGEFELNVPDATVGTDYVYVVPGRGERPDPVSRHQPQGVHGPSRVVDPNAFAWSDGAWRGLPLEELITYELHVGTFTAAGTFEAAMAQLPHLKDLGVTALEIMPVAEFPGARNWGYDGVDLFAPHTAYGGPLGFKRLVDACHQHGLAVILDVVYNHLGPDGNYLAEFGPYFTRRYTTPWGDAVNFDGPQSDEVRRYFVDNALYWLTEFHVDGLRMDAIHGIFDFGACHILEEIKLRFADQARALGRQAWLIAESDLNDARVIEPRQAGGYDVDAQWSDDFHHAAFSILSGARRGYFSDFGRVDDLRKAIAEGFVYDGRFSPFRQRRHGNSSAALPGNKLVICVQNHDQVANGSQGERLSHRLSAEGQRLAAVLLFAAPNLPLLFMGQEFAAQTPFSYFTSHTDPALAEAIRKGRHQEFIHFADAQDRGAWADPQSEETFRRSKLDWGCLARSPHDRMLAFYRDLIALRRRTPALANCRKDLTRVVANEDQRWLLVTREDPEGGRALMVANLSPAPQSLSLPTTQHPLELRLATDDPEYSDNSDNSDNKTPPAHPPRSEGGLPAVVALPAWAARIYASSSSAP